MVFLGKWGYASGLEVRVCHHGSNYAWELWHPGNTEAWKFSVPIYESAEAARNAGSRGPDDHLGAVRQKDEEAEEAEEVSAWLTTRLARA
jgi:hypothetical protein